MRKTIVTLVALCAAMAVNATVLRVSNVSGSTAPYSTVQAALDAAVEGDTIMLDASGTSYGTITINKRIALIGPGFWLQENGIIKEGVEHALTDNIRVRASGVVLSGLYLYGYGKNVEIAEGMTDVVVKRCFIGAEILIGKNANRCVIHQNFMNGHCIDKHIGYDNSSFHQITNNIMNAPYSLYYIHDSYVAYNTILGKNTFSIPKVSSNITLEKNIWYTQPNHATSSFNDNLIKEIEFDIDKQTDKYVQSFNITTHGAFAGDSPYVISCVPSAPIIEDLVVPTTVEYGSNMQVTIKVNVQK